MLQEIGGQTQLVSVSHVAFRSSYVQDLAAQGRRSGPAKVALRPAWRFLRSWILEGGIRDGTRGLLVCGLQSYGVFLKWARLWEMQRTSSQPSAVSSQPSSTNREADS